MRNLLILLPVLFLSFVSTAQNVTEFNGRLTYDVPLINMPTRNGGGASISATYGSGTGVKQRASDIGLGWSLNAGGAIMRSVSGVPDDWKNITTTSSDKKGFIPHYGTLYMKDAGTGNYEMDFYETTWKVDTPAFRFPAYDQYFVSAPGLGGSMEPNMFDFKTVDITSFKDPSTDNHYKVDNTDNDSYNDFSLKPKFNFIGDFFGQENSRHYANEVDANTTFYRPGDFFGPSAIPFDGDGYDNSLVSGDPKNRLISGHYTEYFTNQEIYDHYDQTVTGDEIDGFIDTDKLSSSDRINNCDPNGIGAFRITTPQGMTYHFSLPVYINSVTSGSYPLNMDYDTIFFSKSIKTEEAGSTGNYYIKSDNTTDATILEYKQNNKYAYKWLLVAITGPDFEDNGDEIANNNDQGYWVRYDWEKWTGGYNNRSPEFGFDYSFNYDANDPTKDKLISEHDKISGKLATFSNTNMEIYYLEKVVTHDYQAIPVRELRMDNHSAPDGYDECPIMKINATSGSWNNARAGVLHDDGGPEGSYTNANTTQSVTISPTDADQVKLTVHFFDVYNSDQNDYLKIYDGTTSGATELKHYHSGNLPQTPETVTSTNGDITIEFTTDGSNVGKGFTITWEEVRTNSRPKVTPLLAVKKLVLFDNDDMSNIASAVDIDANSTGYKSVFDIDNTTGESTSHSHYTTDWYTGDKTDIEKYALRIVDFDQDYSLAQKYYANANMKLPNTFKSTSPADVHSNVALDGSPQVIETGKLTLNKITIYDEDHTRVLPPHLFDYNSSNSTDNPEYNPQKIDYWGYHKSDAASPFYSSYTTSSSKDNVDAWCLRKITEPVGRIVEINYESNEYVKVIDNLNGGSRGARRTYMIDDISAIEIGSGDRPNDWDGENWEIILEESVQDFTELKNKSTGVTNQVYIAISTDDDSDSDACTDDHEKKYIAYGNATFGNPSQGFDAHVSGLSYYQSDVNKENYFLDEYPDVWYTSETCIASEIHYTGHGYVYFDLDTTETAYGSGPRVKSLVVKNGNNDSYTTKYEYFDGVATEEPDRFDLPKQEPDDNDVDHYVKLRAFEYSKHRLGPSIGYSKVSVKTVDPLDDTKDNGEIITFFQTTDYGFKNYKTTLTEDTENSWDTDKEDEEQNPTYCVLDGDTLNIIEVIDEFSSKWGQVNEKRIVDEDGLPISITQYEYETPDDGKVVEQYNFLTKVDEAATACDGGELPDLCNYCYLNHETVCIKRRYPSRLKKTTSYVKGEESTTEYQTFDLISGMVTKVKTTDLSGVGITESTPAYTIGQYTNMGSKAKNDTYTNRVTAVAESKSSRDPSIAGTDDFTGHSVTTWDDDYDVLKYSTTNNCYERTAETGRTWRARGSYTWTGDHNKYGIYEYDDFTAFDHTSSTHPAKWRFTGEPTLYDDRGHVLETKGFNDRFNATKYGYNFRFPVAAAGNCNYESFTHTGFEFRGNPETGVHIYEGDVKDNANSTREDDGTTVNAHTGNSYVKISTGNNGPTYEADHNSSSPNKGLLKGRIYRASVWVHQTSSSGTKLAMKLDGSCTSCGYTFPKEVFSTPVQDVTTTTGDWKLLTVDLTIPDDYSPATGVDLQVYVTAGSGEAYIDDMRLQPVESAVSANIYDIRTGRVIATLDNNNFGSKNTYDKAGRVVQVFQEVEGKGFVKVKQNTYHFGRNQ